MRTTYTPATDVARQRRIVDALCRPGVLGPDVQRIETHISYVLLAGGLAYKIKKAVRLDFLDFSTLDARRFFCREELRLNRRFAPSIYLDVVAITGDPDCPAIDGPGEALEYAVRMRAFAQDALLSARLERGEVAAADVDALASVVARFHASAAVADADGPHGRAGDALADALANFAVLGRSPASDEESGKLERLEAWTLDEHATRRSLLDERRRDGFVRECHGDLHLGNIALIDGAITPFDCIEFSERMRWTDVMNDVAFAAMDLRERGRADLSHRFVNAYLEMTGDYAGVALLRLFEVYRALVRAKVAAMRAAQLAGFDRAQEQRHDAACVALADTLALPRRRAMLVTHGLSGCGKTTTTQAILERIGAVRVRTDVERKRLAASATGAPQDPGWLYAEAFTRATYAHVLEVATAVLRAGLPVVVDGACLARWQRDMFRERARALGVDFVLLAFEGDESVLRERVRLRAREACDASDADERVLARQIGMREPPGDDEAPWTVGIDAHAGVVEQLASSGLARLLRALAATFPAKHAWPPGIA